MIEIMVWGVEGNRKKASQYYTGDRTTKNPMELYSFAKVSVTSDLGFCFTFQLPSPTFSHHIHLDLP